MKLDPMRLQKLRIAGYDFQRTRKTTRVVLKRRPGPKLTENLGISLDYETLLQLKMHASERGISPCALARAIIVAFNARHIDSAKQDQER